MRYLDPKNDLTFKKVFGQHPHLLQNLLNALLPLPEGRQIVELEYLPADLLEDPIVREAIEILQESAFTEEELEAYDKYWDQVRTERTMVADSFQKGIEQGEQIGMQKGRAEGMKLTLHVIRLYQQGNTPEAISQTLGLPLSDIRELLSEAGLME